MSVESETIFFEVSLKSPSDFLPFCSQRSQIKLLLMPTRLRRLEWVFKRNPIYFITAATFRRERFLADSKVHKALTNFAEEGPDHGAWLGAYVLMPDHLHAFVTLDDREITLSLWVKSLKNALSKALRASGVPAPHWQKGFFDHVLRSVESYEEKWHYVRENPVRANLVSRWKDWPYHGEPQRLEYRER